MLPMGMEVTMARKPCFNIPVIPQHVIQRGNYREPCCFSEQDYHYSCDALQTAGQKAGCAIHATALMTNQLHLLVTTDAVGSIPAMLQALGRGSVRDIQINEVRLD
jgi:putative transposase